MLMVKAYAAEGLVTKGGRPFTKQTIYKMLHNRMYLGEIVHKGQGFSGQHQVILAQPRWDEVHALNATDATERRRATSDRVREPGLLRGLLFAPDGERLVPSYTVKKGKTYRYFRDHTTGSPGSGSGSTGRCGALPTASLTQSPRSGRGTRGTAGRNLAQRGDRRRKKARRSSESL